MPAEPIHPHAHTLDLLPLVECEMQGHPFSFLASHAPIAVIQAQQSLASNQLAWIDPWSKLCMPGINVVSAYREIA